MSPDDEGMARLLKVADRVEIIEVLSRYHQLIDAKDWDSFAGVFTDDAECGYVRVIDGKVEEFPLATGLPAVTEWLRSSLRPVETMHYMTNHVFTVLEGDRAQSRSYLSVKGTNTGGVYTADHVRGPQGWKIARLVLEQHFES